MSKIPDTLKAEVGGLLQIQSQPEIQSETLFQITTIIIRYHVSSLKKQWSQQTRNRRMSFILGKGQIHVFDSRHT